MSTLAAIQERAFQGPTDELTSQEYHSSLGISSTAFKEFLKSPKHFQTYMQQKREQTQALYDGGMFHSIFLEGKEPVCMPKFDRRTKEGKAAAEEWEAKNKGELVYDWFSTSEANQTALDRLNGMAEALSRKPKVQEIFSEGIAERSFYAQDASGLYMKARTDWLTNDGIIVDIKTTSKSAKPDTFQKSIFDYGYYVSLAWYCKVLSQALGKKIDTCLLIAIEKEAPYESSVYLLKDSVLHLGHQLIDRALPQLASCIEKDYWPGYDETILEVGIPDWAMTKLSWDVAEEA